MKKIFLKLSILLFAFAFWACNAGFNQNKAEDLLQQKELSEAEYDKLLQMYESALEDAIKFSKMKPEEMTEKDREEVITMFAMGKRLVMDEENLTDSQLQELTRINKKGKDELTK